MQGRFCVEKTVNTAWYAKNARWVRLCAAARSWCFDAGIGADTARCDQRGDGERRGAGLRGGRGVFGLHDRSEEDEQACDDDGGLRGERMGHDAGDRLFVYDGLTPERSLELAAAMAVGAVAPLLLQRNGKRGEAPRHALAASAGEHKAIGVFTRFDRRWRKCGAKSCNNLHKWSKSDEKI